MIKHLRKLGFDGPYPGGNHEFMVKEQLRVRLPNPHQSDISRGLLARVLRQAEVSRVEWETL